MTGFATKTKTALSLGLFNIARVAVYRTGLKFGIHPAQRLPHVISPRGIFFEAPTLSPSSAPARRGWENGINLFDHIAFPVSDRPPDWHRSFLSGSSVDPSKPWWQIPDFDPAIGDIKAIWELSRMDWVLAFAQQARNGNTSSLRRLNNWLENWSEKNPPYQGANWKCGQEASIRVMHLTMAALILGQLKDVSRPLIELLAIHLRRIAPTISYAKAQNNNHGTSEAAALFIGGSVLEIAGHGEGTVWAKKGCAALEERILHLVGMQGSFSQYSTTYHRLFLDTISMAEIIRRQFNLPAFSSSMQQRLEAATLWLHCMVDLQTGDAPNVGANDGAHLLRLTDQPYRNFKPSTQLAAALFANTNAYGDGPWNNALVWLGIDVPKSSLPAATSFTADDGGFAVLRRGKTMALLRYPRFKFRPSHADALHADLWYKGENLLRDDGTYGYNAPAETITHFGSSKNHNTIEFDSQNQMPKLSRFLFGDWLKTDSIQQLNSTDQNETFAASYKDRRGNNHLRHLVLEDQRLIIVDDVSGFNRQAILRWRLSPGEWHIIRTDKKLELISVAAISPFSMNVTASVPITTARLKETYESRHYLQLSKVRILEIEIQMPGRLTTEIILSP